MSFKKNSIIITGNERQSFNKSLKETALGESPVSTRPRTNPYTKLTKHEKGLHL
jgi:hypothetical protein